jgi:hypothetical protein
VQGKIYEALSMMEAKDQAGQSRIPADAWSQIQALKSDPIASNLQGKFDLNAEIKQMNKEKIDSLLKTLKDEEDEDNTCRMRFGSKYQMAASSDGNKEFIAKLTGFKAKLEQATNLDTSNYEKFDKERVRFNFIRMS